MSRRPLRYRGIALRAEKERPRLVKPFEGPPPNHRFKLPFFAICAVLFIIWTITGDDVFDVLFNGSCAVLSVFCSAVILSGRNPRWLQSSLDRKEAAKKRSRSN
jgi:hypothetical protein